MNSTENILLFEYLLADASSWESAGASMRREAVMMLVAAVEDVSRVNGFCPAVLVSPLAAEFLERSSGLPPGCRRLLCDNGPVAWLQNPAVPPSEFVATMAIAPESDDVLVDVLKTLQCGVWSAVKSLNVPWSLAEIFTDKLATFHWLCRNGFKSPETKTVCDNAANRLRAESATWFDSPGPNGIELATICNAGIIKPRDGVGCDGISLVPMSRQRFLQLPLCNTADDPWIVQRVLPGTACSIGLIGGGVSNPATVLPPAQQHLIVEFGRLSYIGGQVPCDSRVAEIVSATGRQLAVALGAFSGYLGADIVVTESGRGEQTAHVIEINPRLCASYVGYREHSTSNLMELMLLRNNLAPSWKPGKVVFETSPR
ncbi:MAG: ATP-grasp domain-containing protein [Planctomycetota bacterium]